MHIPRAASFPFYCIVHIGYNANKSLVATMPSECVRHTSKIAIRYKKALSAILPAVRFFLKKGHGERKKIANQNINKSVRLAVSNLSDNSPLRIWMAASPADAMPAIAIKMNAGAARKLKATEPGNIEHTFDSKKYQRIK